MKMLNRKTVRRRSAGPSGRALSPYQARRPRGICPLCEKAYFRWQLQASIESAPPSVRRRIIEVIQAGFPSWTREDGACENCWKAIGGVVRVAQCLRKFRTSARKPLTVLVALGLISLAAGCSKAPTRAPQVMAIQTARAESMESLRP